MLLVRVVGWIMQNSKQLKQFVFAIHWHICVFSPSSRIITCYQMLDQFVAVDHVM